MPVTMTNMSRVRMTALNGSPVTVLIRYIAAKGAMIAAGMRCIMRTVESPLKEQAAPKRGW
jgi:hypothetical protein